MVRLVVAFWAAWCVVAGELDSVTIMSYNIRTASRWATVDGGDGKSGRSWAARKRSVAKTVEISGAAVAGTQEGLAWQVDELVSLLGPDWARVGGGRVGDGSDEDETASVVFDARRVAVVDHGDYWLSETPEVSSKSWGAALPRVATWAVFETRGTAELRRFAVVNVHLDHASDEARSNAAELIRRDAAARRHSLPPAVFLTGDFNALKSDPWYAALTRDGGFVDAWPAASERTCGSCGQATFHDWKGSFAYSKQWLRVQTHDESIAIAMTGERHIDAVFLSRGALDAGAVTKARVITDDKRRRTTGGPFASDHYPVTATYEWRAPGEEAPDL